MAAAMSKAVAIVVDAPALRQALIVDPERDCALMKRAAVLLFQLLRQSREILAYERAARLA